MAMKHFTFDPVLTDAFVHFGCDLYRGDANWIPPLRKDLYAQLSPEFAFYRKPGNCHRHFLATSGRKVVGRISAMVNHDLKDEDGRRVGTIGFFECVDDYGVAEELLDSATQWLRNERGIDRIWAPMNFDIWHGYRLMTRGFSQKPFYGEPYNKPYYKDFFERYGFTSKQLWNSVEVNGHDALEKMIARGGERYQQLISRGYRFERFNIRRFTEEIHKLYPILTRSFCGFLGFTPISLKEFEQLFIRIRSAIHPRFFTFVYDESNVLAGFAAAYLDISDAIRAMKGEDHLIAKLRFISHVRQVNRILFYIAGMTPEEASKRSGLGRAGFYHIIRWVLAEGYDRMVIALMADGNPVRGLLRGNAVTAQRQYTLYELNQ